jgi:hypothetical protein
MAVDKWTTMWIVWIKMKVSKINVDNSSDVRIF